MRNARGETPSSDFSPSILYISIPQPFSLALLSWGISSKGIRIAMPKKRRIASSSSDWGDEDVAPVIEAPSGFGAEAFAKTAWCSTRDAVFFLIYVGIAIMPKFCTKGIGD